MSADLKPSSFNRMLGRAKTIGLTLGVAVAAIVTVIGAHSVLSARAVAQIGPDPAPLTTVEPMQIAMQDAFVIDRRFTGQFEAPQDSALSFEEGGTIAEVLVREGDRVAAGDVLARLDTRLLDAERARLLATRASVGAQVELARRTDARTQALLAEGHATAQRVDETSLQLTQLEASLAEIDAALALVDVRRDKAEMRAPFPGQIGTRVLDAGAVAGPGAPVVTLLETGLSRFRVGLDPALADRLALGDAVTIEAATGVFDARLAEIAPELDAATRSRVAVFEVTETAAPPSRATGEVVIPDAVAERGAWVPLSALRQGPRGSWVVLTVSGEDAPHISLEAAEILHLDAGRAYVRGTFQDGALILPDGTHRVVPGEPVRIAGGAS